MKKNKFWLLFVLIFILATCLRTFGLTKFPPSLYWEEVALGYDAYSIFLTGKDHHGQPWPIVAFESFGDWKPALYFYTIVPFIKLLGLGTWAVRLPSILAGLVIVIETGVLAGLLVKKSNQDKFQLLVMLLTTISPWAIQFSRAGWEVNLATALILSGVVCFLKAMNKKKIARQKLVHLFLAGLLLALSMYAYHAARIIAPLLGLALGVIWLVQKRSWKYLLVPTGIALILITPLLLSLGSSTTTQRFAETSLFSDSSLIEESNYRKQQAGNTMVSRVIYHRYLIFGKEILLNYLDHFNFDFLFISGDVNPRHSVQFMGTFYHLEVAFILLGIYALFNKKFKYRGLLIWWLAVGIFPAALTKTTPHALRILPTLPIWMILIGLGIEQFLKIFKKHQRLLAIGITLVYLGEVTMFWRFYSQVYPQLYGSEWQSGYPELINQIEQESLANPDKTIYVSRQMGRPAMYYWFYTQVDPRDVQAVNDIVEKDQGEFLEFKNIKFIN